MINRVAIGHWVVEVDREATTRMADVFRDDCDHSYCRNFQAAISGVPSVVVDLLYAVGADLAKPVYVSELYENPDGTHLYSVFYDAVGRLVAGPDVRTDVPAHRDQPVSVPIAPGVDVIVWKEPYVPGHFPGEAVEIEFLFNLPWVIE